jgi:hypothetical protein
MSYKTFVNGFPLNASELNGFLMSQVVATFASSTARADAITSPAEGQVTYLENDNKFQYWDGAAWIDFGGAPILTANRAVQTNGSGALSASSVTATELGYLSGVTSSIQTQLNNQTSDWKKVGTTTFSAASTASINNVFSSTYKVYKAIIQLTMTSSAANGFMRMRVSGADNSTGNYNQQSVNFFGTSQQISQTLSGTSWQFLDFDVSGSTSEVIFMNPFESSRTFFNSQGIFKGSGPELNIRGGAFNTTTSFDGFTIYPSSGTINGTISVYGLA